MSRSIELSPAFILHQRPYRETSLLLDVLSQTAGRVSLIAKGVRGKKRSQTGILQLYQPLLLSWLDRGELHTLTGSEAESPGYRLQGHAALCGLYVNELMVKLLPLNVVEDALFSAYKTVLLALQDAENTEIALRIFEKQLLQCLGYGLVIDSESGSHEGIESDKNYYYQPDLGLTPWLNEQQGRPISGRSLQHLSAEQGFDTTSLLEIKYLMRKVIHFYLGGKPLQSRALFTNYRE